jgi:hypothetical protein
MKSPKSAASAVLLLSAFLFNACEGGPDWTVFEGSVALEGSAPLILKDQDSKAGSVAAGPAAIAISEDLASFELRSGPSTFAFFLPGEVSGFSEQGTLVTASQSGQPTDVMIYYFENETGHQDKTEKESCTTSGYCRQGTDGYQNSLSCPGHKTKTIRVRDMSGELRVGFLDSKASFQGFRTWQTRETVNTTSCDAD